jgi:hypothetical protein
MGLNKLCTTLNDSYLHGINIGVQSCNPFKMTHASFKKLCNRPNAKTELKVIVL